MMLSYLKVSFAARYSSWTADSFLDNAKLQQANREPIRNFVIRVRKALLLGSNLGMDQLHMDEAIYRHLRRDNTLNIWVRKKLANGQLTFGHFVNSGTLNEFISEVHQMEESARFYGPPQISPLDGKLIRVSGN
jgi:hypothetical protein